MNWPEAVLAMQCGRVVRRVSEAVRTRLADVDGVPVFEDGTEPIELVAAWTDDMRAVKVFRGAWSGVLFVPSSDEFDADDWIEVPR